MPAALLMITYVWYNITSFFTTACHTGRLDLAEQHIYYWSADWPIQPIDNIDLHFDNPEKAIFHIDK